jgi:predicted GTPase
VSRESPLRGQLARLRDLSDEARAAQVDALCDRLDADRLRVLLVGEAKRGKSTLGNALVGRAVLPSGVVPVTAVSTTVRSGTRDGLQVRYRDGTTRAAPLGDLVDLVDLVTEARNPGNRLGVAEVTACVAGTDLPAGVDLVDTPGVGSVHAHNTAETDTALASMDAAVMVLTADPPISASELALLQRVQQLSVHTLVALHKADRLSGQERGQVLEFTQAARSVRSARSRRRCSRGSARQGLAARQDGDSDLWQASGLAQMQTALLTHLSRHRHDDLLTSLTRAQTSRISKLPGA